MVSMKIQVLRLGEEPEPLRLTLEAGWLARELEGVIHADGEGSGEADLLVCKLGSKLQVTGQIRARFPVSCGRCLEAAEVTVDEPFVMVFEENAPRPVQADLELTEEDLHWETFDGKEVDLGPLLREQLLLAVPMTPLCRADCLGLRDHLEHPAPELEEVQQRLEIDGKPIDPRWNALAKLKPTR